VALRAHQIKNAVAQAEKVANKDFQEFIGCPAGGGVAWVLLYSGQRDDASIKSALANIQLLVHVLSLVVIVFAFL
jgi:glycerate kinase